jgi:hypothetical protein
LRKKKKAKRTNWKDTAAELRLNLSVADLERRFYKERTHELEQKIADLVRELAFTRYGIFEKVSTTCGRIEEGKKRVDGCSLAVRPKDSDVGTPNRRQDARRRDRDER